MISNFTSYPKTVEFWNRKELYNLINLILKFSQLYINQDFGQPAFKCINEVICWVGKYSTTCQNTGRKLFQLFALQLCHLTSSLLWPIDCHEVKHAGAEYYCNAVSMCCRCCWNFFHHPWQTEVFAAQVLHVGDFTCHGTRCTLLNCFAPLGLICKPSLLTDVLCNL